MLEVHDVTCRYGSVTALYGCNLRVDENEVVCLLGSNGAGKSTLIKAITGLLPPAAGRVTFEGRDLHAASSHDIAAAGIACVAEGRRIFSRLSIDDNLSLGGYTRRRDRDLVEDQREEMYGMFPMLADRKDMRAGLLSGGQQQMLAIAQALMAKPRLLILDEPSLGLAPSVVTQVHAAIAELRLRGTTMLLVEQMVHQALALADRGYVLQTGRVVREGEAMALREDRLVHEAYGLSVAE